MPDTEGQPLDPWDGWDQAGEPILRVQPGETSLAAVQARVAPPAPRLDPNRVRVKCEESGCWSEAHETRALYGVTFRLCPRHADAWDADEAAEDAALRHERPVADRSGRAAPSKPRMSATPEGSQPPQDAPGAPEEPDVAAGAVPTYQVAARAFRAQKGIAERPRETMPSRQDRSAEYAGRKRKRVAEARARRSSSAKEGISQ